MNKFQTSIFHWNPETMSVPYNNNSLDLSGGDEVGFVTQCFLYHEKTVYIFCLNVDFQI